MTIKHITMFTVKKDAKKEEIHALLHGLLGLASKIQQIKSNEVGADLCLQPSHPAATENRSLCWTVCFETKLDFAVFERHPAHEKVETFMIQPLVQEGTRATIQYEC